MAASNAFATSTALADFVPLLIKMAISSALLKTLHPFKSSFSLAGRQLPSF
jgi:hypothetical protein